MVSIEHGRAAMARGILTSFNQQRNEPISVLVRFVHKNEGSTCVVPLTNGRTKGPQK